VHKASGLQGVNGDLGPTSMLDPRGLSTKILMPPGKMTLQERLRGPPMPLLVYGLPFPSPPSVRLAPVDSVVDKGLPLPGTDSIYQM
jgi:hypothetical protein